MYENTIFPKIMGICEKCSSKFFFVINGGKKQLKHKTNCTSGVTLVELLCVVAIMGILSTALVPAVHSVLEDASYSAAAQELSSLHTTIQQYYIKEGHCPDSWTDMGYEKPVRDPWGNEYVYLNHSMTAKGKWRKDGPVVPINSYYDLFSPGPDGEWSSSIYANISRDDVIVADDGQFIGRVTDY